MLYSQRKTRRFALPNSHHLHKPRIVFLEDFLEIIGLKLQLEIVRRVRQRILRIIGRNWLRLRLRFLASQGNAEILGSSPSARPGTRHQCPETYIRSKSTSPIGPAVNTGFGAQSTLSKGAPQLAEILATSQDLVSLYNRIARIEE